MLQKPVTQLLLPLWPVMHFFYADFLETVTLLSFLDALFICVVKQLHFGGRETEEVKIVHGVTCTEREGALKQRKKPKQ